MTPQIPTGEDRPPVIRNVFDAEIHEGAQRQLLRSVIHRDVAPGMGDHSKLSGLAVLMPAGHTAKTHIHANSDICVGVLRGRVTTGWGVEMAAMPHDTDTLVAIPAGVEHAGVNLTDDETFLIEVRTDPWGNDDVVLLPELTEALEAITPDTPAAPLGSGPHPVERRIADADDASYQTGYRRVLHQDRAPGLGLSAGVLSLAPGARLADVWRHAATERLMFCDHGEIGVLWGPDMQVARMKPFDYGWFPTNQPYTVVNLSEDNPARVLEFRTDPTFDGRGLMRTAEFDHLVGARLASALTTTGSAA